MSCVLSWSCLTLPRFSTMSHYKSDLPCLRQVGSGDLRDLDCSITMSEWVAGLSSDYFVQFPLLLPPGIISVTIWLYLGLLKVFNIANVWICFPDSDPTDGSRLVTGLEWVQPRFGGENGVINISEWQYWCVELEEPEAQKCLGPPWISDTALQAPYYLEGFSRALWLLAAPLCIRFDLKILPQQ